VDGYTDYRIILEPTGPVGTPWQSDTLFGHLAWMVAMEEGEKAVENFLEPFLDGEPPFVLSDGFPNELLPKPLLDAGGKKPETIEEHMLLKKAKKARFLSPDDFESARRKGEMKAPPPREPYLTRETLHSQPARTTGTTGGDGALFPTYDTYVRGEDGESPGNISVYARCFGDSMGRLKELVERLSAVGYGRDKSTGTGAFRMRTMVEFDGFAPFEGADGFISLSSFVPAENDPLEGRWSMRVKRGFLGEHAGRGNPFKRPLIQFEPGAVFRTGTPPKPWYGRVVRNIAPGMPKAVQNCMCLAVPCRYPGETK